MNKYVLKFRKEGYIKYTSHLDLIRLFHRAFKMSGLKLDYSAGFNPHPKMSFVQPLSLGYSSRAELLEFELKNEESLTDIINNLNLVLPTGLSILDVTKYEESKPLAGNVLYCEYNIYFPKDLINIDFSNLLNQYLDKKDILVNKKTKKGDIKEINIRPMIRELKINELGEFYVIFANLDSGSYSNLSPELLISSLIDFGNLGIERSNIEVERLKIGFSNNFEF